MSLDPELKIINHYYSSHRYDEAINKLHCLMRNCSEKSDRKIALINTWLGKCFLSKFQNCTYSHNSPLTLLPPGHRVAVRSPRRDYPKHKRMTQEALNYFKKALKSDPTFIHAYYWKGKTLEYENKIDKAFKCFAKAAILSNKLEYRQKCCDYFATHHSLKFRKTRSLKSITINEALNFCSSSNSYLRLEACQYLIKFPPSSKKMIDQVKIILSSLAGYQIFCSFVPYTGDPDIRVRRAAQEILSNITN